MPNLTDNPSDEALLAELLGDPPPTAGVPTPPYGMSEGSTVTVVDEAPPLTHLARILAESPPRFGIINENRYRDLYMTRPVEWRNTMTVGYLGDHMDPAAVSRHNPSADGLDDSELRDDDTNSDVVNRWSTGQWSDAEVRRMGVGCPCSSCCMHEYERVIAHVGAAPQSYHGDCRCPRCRNWRRQMALAIQDVILRQPLRAVPTYNVTVNMRDVVLRPDDFSVDFDELISEDVTLELEAARAARLALRRQAAPPTPTDAFERQRVRRGHPLVKNPLPEGWRPNVWEA